MSRPARFLFDECIGRPRMDGLRAAVMTDKVMIHITDIRLDGTPDEVWIPQLKDEFNWIVISADRGRKSKHGSKLPDLCVAFGITHILLSGKLHQANSQDKLNALISMWSEIEALELAPPGQRCVLRYKSTNVAGTVTKSVVLERRAAKPSKRR